MHWHYPSPEKGGCERLVSLPVTGHHSLELCLGKMAQGPALGAPGRAQAHRTCSPKATWGGAGAVQHVSIGVAFSLASPQPLPSTHTQRLWPSSGRKPAGEGKSTSGEEAWPPPASTQQIAVCLSSLLFRMPVPVRPAWNLESHRAQPIHKPLPALKSVEDSGVGQPVPSSLAEEPLRQHLAAG